MSFIITADVEAGKYKILADAKHINQVQIYATDFKGWLINITGHAEKPFIHRVRFVGCTIVAEDLSAFYECYFDDDCEMIIKNIPVVNGCESTGKNRAIKQP
jgi:hypothetical protein